jgi:hypothetical protein
MTRAPGLGWRRPAGAVAASLVLLTGCSPPEVGGAADAAGTPVEATTAPSTATALAEQGVQPPPVADPSEGASPPSTTPSTTPSAQPVMELEMFSSPSGNILCGMGADEGGEWARCDIREKDWASPPQPADCPLDWGHSITTGPEGARFACVGDAVGDPANPLPYGRSLQLGRLECRSERSGMTCEHLDTGRGFTLARGGYTLF